MLQANQMFSTSFFICFTLSSLLMFDDFTLIRKQLTHAISCKLVTILPQIFKLKKMKVRNIHLRFFFIGFFKGNNQCRRYGGARCAMPRQTAACAPNFGLLKILFLKHHITTRQQTMMEKML